MAKDRAALCTELVQTFQAGQAALHATPFIPRRLEAAIADFAQVLMDVGRLGLTFTVTARGLEVEHTVVGAGPEAEALAASLWRDGVKSVTFAPGLSQEEALPLVAAWLRTAEHPNGTDSVATRVWETLHSHVTLTLHAPAVVLGDARAREAEALVRGWTSTPTVPPYEVVHLSDERVVPTLRALEALDVVPEAGVVDREEWVRQVEALGHGLTAARARAVERFADVLVHTGDRATTQQEAAALAGVIDRLVRTLGQERRFAEAVDAFKHASHEPQTAAGRAVVSRFKASVTSPAVMAWLVESLNSADGAGDALMGVRHMGAGAARSLLGVPGLTADGRRRLAALMAELEVDATRAAQQAVYQSTESTLHLVNRQAVPDAVASLKKALSSPDAAVRRRALEVMTPDHAVRLADVLHERLHDLNPQVRLLALHHVAEMEDPSALPALLAQLQRSTVTGEERVKLYDTLARIGGPRAAAALVGELQHAEPPLRVEAAKALGRVDHPKVREALQAEAERLLAPPALKAACRAALTALGGQR